MLVYNECLTEENSPEKNHSHRGKRSTKHHFYKNLKNGSKKEYNKI